jgi:hypothetical protein
MVILLLVEAFSPAESRRRRVEDLWGVELLFSEVPGL